MNPRKLLRIARWEVTRGAGGVSRSTVVVGLVTLVFVAGVVPFALSAGFVIDEGIYRVGVDEASPYHPVVTSDPTFAVTDPSAELGEDIDVRIRGMAVERADTEKGRAALAELRASVESYNDRVLLTEDNQSAAFPVQVSLTYVDTEADVTAGTDAGGGAGGSGDGGDGSAGGGDGAGGGTGGSASPGGLPTVGGLFQSVSGDTPSSIQPPFPFQSLVLAFVFVLPLNFVIQAYGSSMLSERLNRRGELLLVTPVSRGDIIVGKTLPYFLASLVVSAVIVGLLNVGGGDAGAVSVLAVAPLALLFLATTFVGAMMARSFKELTFVTVTVSVFLTSFAFVPAVFTNVGPIALISPLTLVVRDLSNDPMSTLDIAFAVLPATLTGVVLYGFGAGLYREEDLFTQRPIPLKVLDALAGRIRSRRSVALVVALLIPFVFVAELLAVAVLFALPVGLSLPVIFVVVAVIEEAAKSLPTVAGFHHNRFDRRLGTAVVVGAFAGLGFFVAEKSTLVVQLVGLPETAVTSQVAFASGTGLSGLLILTFLLAPLVLHVVTATISAVGATRGSSGYVLGYSIAVGVHTLYNLGVVVLLEGFL